MSLFRRNPHILCVNPWIHDFAAYDFWSKPLGLLKIASILRAHNFPVSYIDCLDRFHPRSNPADPAARYGRGPYLKTRIPKPSGLDDIPRNYSRYGIQKQWFEKDLRGISPPDIIFVTSLMTYWYPGVRETIEVIKTVYPDIPVVLGGIYATLCPMHAETHIGADRIHTGIGIQSIRDIISECCGFTFDYRFDPDDIDAIPLPAFDLQRKISYVAIQTAVGCPFGCAYCASRILNPGYRRRSPTEVVDEIRYWHTTYGVEDFILYDDAFLIDPESHAVPILETIIDHRLDIRFHTPNALHIRGITEKTAKLLHRSGFKTIRLGLETTAFENRDELDGKVNASEFERAALWLKKAGFRRNNLGAYLLAGLPGQSINDVAYSIGIVKKHDMTPVIAYYSPIPGTSMWDQATSVSRYDLNADPIFTNNAIFPCWPAFSWETLTRFKNLAGAY